MSDDLQAAQEALAGRLFTAGLGTAELLTVYLGGKLGLYDALHKDGPATTSQLAQRSGIDQRYAQEWLEQQAAAGFVVVDDVTKDPDARVFTLPEAHVGPLLDRDNAFSIEPVVRMMVPTLAAAPKLVDAYRDGGGVAWSDFGAEAIEAQGDFNRPWLNASLGSEYLPSIPDLDARLSDVENPALVADVACGLGWAAIAIAIAYPNTTVDGFDLDEHSILLARKNAAEAGVADRVTFEVRDAADPANKAKYDFAIVVEAIHDLSDPVAVLRAINTMLKPDGSAIIADARVADTFTAPADETERFIYAFSVIMCLPAGRADAPSAATGTVMRADTFRRYAKEAGFGTVSVLDQIEHPMLRFYRLAH